ncbi:unnamed protein product [Schistosoma mattheei]|uniref:Uncharacterized protein n=1 Tax=Schistosoma mattheei TaxID=31246 RepID=A0A183PB03_9TREM|nr:unnamed protein product [Schistosoma mattheei]
MQLDDLNFLDDLAILHHSQKQIQVNTASVAPASEAVDLNINSIKLDGETLEKVNISTIGGQGGSDADVKTSIGKATTAFLQLKNIWNSKQLSTNINVIIFNTNVKTILLNEDDSWRTTTTIIKMYKYLQAVVCTKYYQDQSTAGENKPTSI